MNYNIINPGANRYASILVNMIFENLPIHWKSQLPAIEVKISTLPFEKVTEIFTYCCEAKAKDFNFQRKMIICPDLKKVVPIIWVRFDEKSTLINKEYFFQRELYLLLGELMWENSKVIQNFTRETYKSAFLETFEYFFVSPEYLKEYVPAAFSFMKSIDDLLLNKNKSVKI